MPAPLRRAARAGRTLCSFAVPALILFCALVPEPAFAKCRQGECWGAIAFSRLTGYWVYSMNHPNKSSARSRAWLMCEKRCSNVMTVKNGCLALFLAQKGRYAAGEGPAEEQAIEAARRQCRAKYAGCALRVVRCTADFEELKRRALEKQRNADEQRRPLVVPKQPPPAPAEELKLKPGAE